MAPWRYRTLLRPVFAAVALLLLLSCSPGPATPVLAPPGGGLGASGIAGTVRSQNGRPAAGAWVYAYRNPRGNLRGPADFAAETDAAGAYFLDLVEGDYWLVARLRQGGGESGPPQPGDAWALFPDNPIAVAPSRVGRADFVLMGGNRPQLGRNARLASSDTGFTGSVVDASGQPVAGVIAMAYRDSDFHRMPDVTSPATQIDGHFILHVPAAGRYCLVVRSGSRGQPVAGELYGLLGRGEDACREVGSGQMLDVGTLTVTPYRR
ncbi:hypothetical protein DBW_0387 [Desulfuromonas sp. DDH964]|nr:hypothetical protein DBW_0387 [Desulfuromonas sp. DDH964]